MPSMVRIARLRNMRHRAAERLCNRGILTADEDKVLFVFPRKLYPTRDAGPEQRMLARLRDAIFTDRPEIDPRAVVLLSLASGANLLKIRFDKRALKEHKQRIERVVNGDLIGQSTNEVIQAVQAAAMVACVMPAVMVALLSG